MRTPDLRTRYLGLELASPLVASASPLCADLDTLRRIEAAGAGAVVLPSLFEEQIEEDALVLHGMLETGAESHPEAAGYFPVLEHYNTGPERYLRHVETARHALGVPVIASLNGASPGGWTRYAGLLEQAGASAVELNLYAVEADPMTTSEQVEARHLEVVAAVRAAVAVPVAVKLSPFYSAMASMARRLADAGADALVLFNRFLQPDIDLETLAVVPSLHLSTSEELRLPLRWIAILRDRVDADLAATTGVHQAEDALKLLLAGADVVMLASALLRHGPEHITAVLDGMRAWMTDHEYVSVAQLRGSMSQASCPDLTAFERSQYLQTLAGFSADGHQG